MKNLKSIRFFCFVFLALILLTLFSTAASANSPLWPDIIIRLDKPYDGDYVVAVLSDRNAFSSSWDEIIHLDDRDRAAIEKIRSTDDEDGYRYIAYSEPHNKENGRTELTYAYDTLKIALYFPESETLVKTDILQKDSYIEVFKLTLDDTKIAEVQSAEYSKKTFDAGEYHPAVTVEKPFITRMVVTKFFINLAVNLVLEILIALAFGYRKWRHLLCIAVTNIVTLVLLTASLILLNPPVADGMLTFPLAFFEIAVAAVEAIVYVIAFKRFEYREKYRPWLVVIYAVVANAITYVVGSLYDSLSV